MPNYNDRRFKAESYRRDADELEKKYGNSRRVRDDINGLIQRANMLDEQNQREQPDRYRQDMEMRENPRYTGGRDIPRQEYDEEMEMRRGRGRGARRDSMGRYAEMDNEPMTNSYYPYPMPIYSPYMMANQPQNEMDRGGNYGTYRQHDYPMSPHMAMQHQNEKPSKIGFTSNKGYDKHAKHGEKFEELKKYYGEMIEKLEEGEIPHAKMEAEELFSYWTEAMKEAMQKAKTPEGKQMLQQEIQKSMQKLQQMR